MITTVNGQRHMFLTNNHSVKQRSKGKMIWVQQLHNLKWVVLSLAKLILLIETNKGWMKSVDNAHRSQVLSSIRLVFLKQSLTIHY